MSYSTGLGSNTAGTTFPDIIINTVEGTATNRIAGFAALVYNPRSLKATIEGISKLDIPDNFPDAIVLRREEENRVKSLWDFPLACSCPVTCPLPWTIIEATVKSKTSEFTWEFNIMKTLNFIGRNILRIDLPMIDTREIQDNLVSSGRINPGELPNHTYLGAWHRDLIPRLIKAVSVYPRSSAHELYVYSGYDLFMYNLVFGNERKEMNDLMSGEDRFELNYDPFRVDGSAMGIASYRGIDTFALYTVAPGATNDFNQFNYNNTGRFLGVDGITDFWQPDDNMDIKEFAQCYRKNVWYEAPVATNYWARHSIHSRRMRHYAKSIDVPLDILPFSYSLSSALATAALSGECGFIKVELYDNWLDRAFYLTRMSDVPPTHPIPQHVHFEEGDTYKNADGTISTITAENPLTGWINTRSLGRFGDAEFKRSEGPGLLEQKPDGTIGDVTNNFNSTAAYSVPGSIAGTTATARRENLLPTRLTITGTTDQTAIGPNGNITVDGRSKLDRKSGLSNAINISTTAWQAGADIISNYGDVDNLPFIYKVSTIDSTAAALISRKISVHLFQIGFQTMQCIVEWLTKMPNVYVCTEWADMGMDLKNADRFEINNSLYQTNNFFWIIPSDRYGTEYMRYYPCHAINHELPIVNTMKISTMLSQGVCTYDWDMMNIVTPAFMGFQHPLLENIGVVSFCPDVQPNKYPLAYYDPNICGKINVEFHAGEDYRVGDNQFTFNVRNGKLLVISTGVNGIIVANLSMFRMVF